MSATPTSNWRVPLSLLTLGDLTIGLGIWVGFSINLAEVEWVLLRECRRRVLPVTRQRTSLLGARS